MQTATQGSVQYRQRNTSQTLDLQTYLAKGGGRCGGEAKRERAQQLGQNGLQVGGGATDESDGQVTHVEATRLGLGRLQELGDDHKYVVESCCALSVVPTTRKISMQSQK